MSQFGGSAHDDDYGYFGTHKVSGSGSTFGGPAAATSHFGGPPVSSFGTPTAMGPPSTSAARTVSSSQKRWILLVLGLVVAAGVFWFGRMGWDMHQASKPIVLPGTVAGMPVNTEPRLQSRVDASSASALTVHPFRALEGELYGTKTAFAIVMVGRGTHLSFDESKVRSGLPPLQTVGHNQCATLPENRGSVCLRVSRTLFVEVGVFGSTADASAAVDEVWAAQ